MAKEQILHQIGFAAAAGLVGTAAFQAARIVNQKVAPVTDGARREVPGEAMIDRVREALPPRVRSAVSGVKGAASVLLSFGYTSTGAAIYSSIRERPRVLLDGAGVGLAVWAAGRLRWLPELGVSSDTRRGNPKQVVVSLAQHVLYGIAAVTAYRAMRRKLSKNDESPSR
jgi:hypothetical protein